MKHIKTVTAMVTTIGLAGLLSACGTEPQGEPHSHSPADMSMVETEGCLSGPTEQFGRYIGDWAIEDWQLSREDATTWIPQQGARWIFACVGNGVAVQDFWYPNAGGASPSNMGTNLRMYDPKTEKWEIAWTANGAPGFTHIQAKEDADGNIVMDYISPEQNPPRRIIFRPPTAEGWDWVMQVSLDGGENWVGVYKIKATPYNATAEG